MKKLLLAIAAICLGSTAAVAAGGMDCCKDCACCKDKPAGQEQPPSAPKP